MQYRPQNEQQMFEEENEEAMKALLSGNPMVIDLQEEMPTPTEDELEQGRYRLAKMKAQNAHFSRSRAPQPSTEPPAPTQDSSE